MKSNMLAIFLGMCVSAGAFGAPTQSNPPANSTSAPASSTWDSVKIWFQHWKDGLASSAVEGQYEQKSLTAVAAVRGDEQKLDDPNKPYIKGRLEDKQALKLKKERAELSQAVDLILAGKIDDGSKKLDEFETKHPKSPLMADVRKAREKLKGLKQTPRS